MSMQKSLLFLFGFILTSCSFAPPYHRFHPPIPDSYSPHINATETKGPQISWQDFFMDPELKQLICLALENNRDLRIAIQRVEEARALYGIRWADQFPSINLNALRAKLRIPADLSPTGLSTIFEANLVAFNLSSWELDFWGRIRSLKDAALDSYLATDEAQRAALISLIEQVANTYLKESELIELMAIAERTIAAREESYRIAKRRYEVGSASKLDAVQAETLLNQARSDWTILKRQRELNWNAMTLLLGISTPSPAKRLSEIEPYFFDEISPGLPSELLNNRPDILAAEYRLKAAHANIGAARAAFFPAITLTGSRGTLSSELQGLFGPGSTFWSFLPSISLPVFDASKNSSNLDLAEARRFIALSEYERTVQVAFKEVSDALTERLWLAEQILVQEKSLAAQSERTRLALLRYERGASLYLEVLDAERDRFAVEQSLVQTRRAWLSSHVSLYAALGGGIYKYGQTEDRLSCSKDEAEEKD